MPKAVVDIGFTIIPHPRCADTTWVFPMDRTDVWPRPSPGGWPAVYRTQDAGESWERQDAGFPAEQGWFTVKRQAFCADRSDPLGLYFGTTDGVTHVTAVGATVAGVLDDLDRRSGRDAQRRRLSKGRRRTADLWRAKRRLN